MALIQSTDMVLPPYASQTDPISALSRGTYNASDYGAAWTSHPGSILPSTCGGITGGRISGARKRKTRRSTKSKKHHKKQAAKKHRKTRAKK